MSRIYQLLLAVACMVPGFGFTQSSFTTSWNNAFTVESTDKNFQFKFGGRMHYDMAWLFQDNALDTTFGKVNSGTEFRRVRFYNQGKIYHNVFYKVQLDFAGGAVAFKDVFLEFSGIPALGNLRVGQMKEPLRIEALTSSNYITLPERSFHLFFSPERNTGLMFHNELRNRRLGWQIGLFRNAGTNGNDREAGSHYNLTIRLSTHLPIAKADGHYVHLGLGYSLRLPKEDKYSVSGRPSSRMAPAYVSTGTITDVDNVQLLNLEGAWVFGPLSFQTEYLHTTVNTTEDFKFSAWYGQVSWFITGEHRPWASSYTGFGRVEPTNYFGAGKGAGAWELALRYSAIDLNDNTMAGGKMIEWTLGANWYLNPATRIMLQYAYTELKGVGNTGIVLLRFMVFF